jgi:hypothetical protein
MVPYMSVRQSIRNNGNRHFANAQNYAAVGNKEFAFGSYRKALRNWNRADEQDQANETFALMLDDLAENLAFQILSGSKVDIRYSADFVPQPGWLNTNSDIVSRQ